MYGFKIVCEISKVVFEILHTILNPHITEYAFYEVLNISNLWYLTVMAS